ncbi:Gar1/Naf1 RNA binding region-domain-containing protein [Syncephalis fuscata]|nr:Gar1/Naf1 RNA binding region-domain-containing protein [Syncephalis fuscata]
MTEQQPLFLPQVLNTTPPPPTTTNMDTVTTMETATEETVMTTVIDIDQSEQPIDECMSDSSDLPTTSSYESSSESEKEDSDTEGVNTHKSTKHTSQSGMTANDRARYLKQLNTFEDDEEGGGGSGGPLKTQNEIEPPVPNRPNIELVNTTPITPLGVIKSIMKSQANSVSIIISQNMMQESRPLDIGSVIVLENRMVLGEVFDTFGPIVQPLYTVRLASEAELNDMALVADMPVYYLPTHTQFVLTQELRKIKGSDASNFYDEEVAEDVRLVLVGVQ